MRDSHVRDCAALVKYFAWLDKELKNGAKHDEIEAAEQLRKFRAEQDLFVYPSFETISATGPNSADIHYKPVAGTHVDRDLVYLCDSGG